MMKLADILKEMADDMPGLISTGVCGMDGLVISEYNRIPGFNTELAAAQFALVMRLVKKTCSQLGEDDVEDNLVTTDKVYLVTLFLGDGSYYLGITIDKENSSLGNIRIVARKYADKLWEAIPGKK